MINQNNNDDGIITFFFVGWSYKMIKQLNLFLFIFVK
jgi:hypothetical protein